MGGRHGGRSGHGRRGTLALTLGLSLAVAATVGAVAGGCGGTGTGSTPPQPEPTELRQRLAALADIEIPVVRAEGVYGIPFVRTLVMEAESQAKALQALDKPQPLSLFFKQLDSHAQAAVELLRALEAQGEAAGGTGATGGGQGANIPASTSLALEEANTALANAEAIRAYFRLQQLGPEAFKREVQAGLQEARRDLDRCRLLVLDAEQAETSLTRYFHLPILELALEGAQAQDQQAQGLLEAADQTAQGRLFLAASDLAMMRRKLALFDYLWQRGSAAPAGPALEGPVSAALPTLEDLVGGPGTPARPCPFPAETQAYRRWQDGTGYWTAAQDQAGRGFVAFAVGEALNARASWEVATWLEPVGVGPPPAGGCGCDLAGMRRLVARFLGSARDSTLALEGRGLSLPWLWTSLASVSAAMARSDRQVETALGAGVAADLPSLEQSLALAYADALAKSLRCVYTVEVVERLMR